MDFPLQVHASTHNWKWFECFTSPFCACHPCYEHWWNVFADHQNYSGSKGLNKQDIDCLKHVQPVRFHFMPHQSVPRANSTMHPPNVLDFRPAPCWPCFLLFPLLGGVCFLKSWQWPLWLSQTRDITRKHWQTWWVVGAWVILCRSHICLIYVWRWGREYLMNLTYDVWLVRRHIF